MRYRLLAPLALVSYTADCGKVSSAPQEPADAAEADTAVPVDAAVDAPNVA